MIIGTPIGRRDEADIHADGLHRAHPAEALCIEQRQQLGLELRVHFADLVQEQHAAIRGFDQPGLGDRGAREGAALMPEQLAFHQAGGDGGAVHIHEGAVGACSASTARGSPAASAATAARRFGAAV
jgi:hypothetical protein